MTACSSGGQNAEKGPAERAGDDAEAHVDARVQQRERRARDRAVADHHRVGVEHRDRERPLDPMRERLGDRRRCLHDARLAVIPAAQAADERGEVIGAVLRRVPHQPLRGERLQEPHERRLRHAGLAVEHVDRGDRLAVEGLQDLDRADDRLDGGRGSHVVGRRSRAVTSPGSSPRLRSGRAPRRAAR